MVQLNNTDSLLNQAEVPTLIAQNTAADSWQMLPYKSPILPITAALMHTGKIFFSAGSGNDPENTAYPNGSAVWDVNQGTFIQPVTPVDAAGLPLDLFCVGHSFLPDGRLLVLGGTLQYDPFYGAPYALLFDPKTEQWTTLPSMNYGRWYPTVLLFGDGRVLALSGTDQNGIQSTYPEIYTEATGWTAFTQPTSPLPNFAHLFLLSNGQLFYSGCGMGGNGGVTPRLLTLPTDPTQQILEQEVPGLEAADYGNQAASMLLPPAQDQKVMIIGGGNGNATNRVNIVDLTADNPTYTPAAYLHNPRMHHNAVLLPDRTVLVVNGSQVEEDVTLTDLPAEIYNPATNTWTQVATPKAKDRVYHSIALLLPDGRVVTAGGNPNRLNLCLANNQPPDQCQDLRLEIYRPAYMSQPRPLIWYAPQQLHYGTTITLQAPQAGNLKWVSLIKPMSNTHTCDTDQRLVDLPIRSNVDYYLSVAVTDNPNLAPPGWYMLFITDKDGVPSVAKWVHLTTQAPVLQAQQVTAYADANFGGASQSFSPGIYRAATGDLNRVGNDTISSLRVPPGFQVQVCNNADGSGPCGIFGPGDYTYVGDTLNDIISYLHVQTN